MNEIGQYQVFKEKLQGICDENNLTYSIQNKKYPFMLTIKPLSGIENQMDMLEAMGENGSAEGNDTGYISPDASLVFAFEDGKVIYRISETFTISDALFNKLKNLFKKLRDMWMAYFFRDVVESGRLDYVNMSADAADEATDEQDGDFDAEDEEECTEEEVGAEGDAEPENDDEQ